MKCWPAVLLLGPTGSGKTPLGALLEMRGLAGRRCHHFDFGAQLRQINAEPEKDSGLTTRELSVIRRSLQTGTLLRKRDFSIARKILMAFLRARKPGPRDLLILNGLPRHLGQAQALEAVLRVRWVVHLVCTPDTVQRRIQFNIGGDRAGRGDDSLPEITRKLGIFQRQTLPLLDYYVKRGVKTTRLLVGVNTQPRDLWRQLQPIARRWLKKPDSPA